MMFAHILVQFSYIWFVVLFLLNPVWIFFNILVHSGFLIFLGIATLKAYWSFSIRLQIIVMYIHRCESMCALQVKV